MKPLTKKPVVFRWHIDHIENPRGDVWALSWCERGGVRRQVEACHVKCCVPTDTVFRGAKSKQPRAYIIGHGTIWFDSRTLEAVIK